MPIQGPYKFVNNEDESEIPKLPCRSPEIKVEVVDEPVEESEKMYKHGKDEMNLVSEIYNKDLKPYDSNCPYCWKKFDENCNLRDHMRVHSNVYLYECAICGLRLKTKKLLKSHVLLHDLDLLHCAHCDFKSAEPSTLKRHQIEWHAYIYKCQFCSELFQNKMEFLKHMEHHTAVADCNICGQSCEDNCHLSQHKCKHQNDKNYIHKQLQCEDKSQNNENYEIVKKCEFNKFNSQECRNLRLNRDLNLPKEEKFFKCPQCRWSFRTMNVLNKHMKRHLRNFKCNECDAVFKYKASFLKHKHKHAKRNKVNISYLFVS